MGHVLLVEDDGVVREAVTLLLEEQGFDVAAVAQGASALDVVVAGDVEAVVLDLMLPDIDGFEVCRRIRAVSEVPVVMVTARDQTSDIVHGLELGADDYITKPFEAQELVARVRAAMRRRTADLDTDPVLTFGPLAIDVRAAKVELAGSEVALSATEFRLLVELCRRPGEALSRQALLQLVWGYDYLGDSRLVDMAIMRLRYKLGDDVAASQFITTVRGLGYRFESPEP